VNHSRSSSRAEEENPYSYAEIKPVCSVSHPIALPTYSLTYLGSDDVQILDHGSPNRGLPRLYMETRDQIVNHVYNV